MSEILRAAVVQMGSTSDKEANLDRCEAFVRQAAENGCKLIVLPENFPFIGGLKRKVEMAEPVSNDQPGPIVGRFKKLAAELDAHLILGGIPTLAEAGRCHNTSILLNNEGNIAAHYHKVHLFDIAIAGSVTFAESEFVVPGKESILANAAGRKVGLTICYDLRFPELYRDLTKKGCEIVTVPAAFTMHTGKDHWLPLLKARAIENQLYVLAANQYGRHNPERESYGKSAIIDPWGNVIALASDCEGIAIANLDFSFQKKIRSQLPCLHHRRL